MNKTTKKTIQTSAIALMGLITSFSYIFEPNPNNYNLDIEVLQFSTNNSNNMVGELDFRGYDEMSIERSGYATSSEEFVSSYYDENGYDKDGYNRAGINRTGHNKNGQYMF